MTRGRSWQSLPIVRDLPVVSDSTFESIIPQMHGSLAVGVCPCRWIFLDQDPDPNQTYLMCPTDHSGGAGDFVAPWRRAVTFAACIGLALVAELIVAVGRPVWGGQPRPPYQRTNGAEVVPAPLPAATQSKEPLAEFFSDEEYKDEVRGIGQLNVDIRPRDVPSWKACGRYAAGCGRRRAVGPDAGGQG